MQTLAETETSHGSPRVKVPTGIRLSFEVPAEVVADLPPEERDSSWKPASGTSNSMPAG